VSAEARAHTQVRRERAHTFCVVTPAQAGVHLVRSLAEFTLSWQSQILRCAQDDSEGLCRNSTCKSFRFSIACAVILSPHFGRRTPVVYSVRQPPANCRGPSLRSPETRCVSHFDSPSLGCHSEPAFWAKNPRSLLCSLPPPRTAGVLRFAQDDSKGHWFSLSSFCPSLGSRKAVNAQNDSEGLRMTSPGVFSSILWGLGFSRG
jgi:hypothetical protein